MSKFAIPECFNLRNFSAAAPIFNILKSGYLAFPFTYLISNDIVREANTCKKRLRCSNLLTVQKVLPECVAPYTLFFADLGIGPKAFASNAESKDPQN